jgi:Ca-activated chloride channel family protein
MDLLAPGALLLLGLLPVLVGVRIWILRRGRSGLRYSSLSLVREALPRSSRIRRHLPFALFVVALASLVVALARPVNIVSVPAGQTTVILAMDVSRSMCATDIEPNRLLAAEAAASSFIEGQGSTTQIGVVAFAGFAEIVQTPTTDQEVLLDVVQSLTTGRRTAIGSAILEALDAIAEIDKSVAPSQGEDAPADSAPAPVPNGAYAPAIVVLLTDGANNAGPLPTDAAQQAAARGVRVYTIGFGTDDPGAGSPNCGVQFVGREPAESPGFGGFGGGGGGGGGGFRRAIDEPTLMAIADATGGTYYPAESADELHTVFENLPTNLITKHEVMEVSVAFAALGVICIALAILLGQAWRPLP